MQDYQHVNKYMIEFSKHATHMGWNNATHYGEFIEDLLSTSRTSSFHWNAHNFPTIQIQCLKGAILATWKCQGKKGAPTSWNQQSSFGTTPPKQPIPQLLRQTPRNLAKSSTGNQFGADGKLTEVEMRMTTC